MNYTELVGDPGFKADIAECLAGLSPSAARIFCKKKAYVNVVENKGVVFVHNPRCGGVSVTGALYGRHVGHHSAGFLKNVYPNIWEKSFIVSVVRHPVDRFMSAIRYLQQGGTSDAKIGYRGEYVRQLGDIEKVIEWLSRPRHHWLVDYTLQRQVNFILSGNIDIHEYDLLVPFDCIGELDSLLSYLCSEKKTLSYTNSSLGLGGVKQKKSEAISPQVLNFIQNYYKQDFELYETVKEMYPSMKSKIFSALS